MGRKYFSFLWAAFILFTASFASAQGMAAGKGLPSAKAVDKFLAAIHAGDAAAIKALLAQPVRAEDRAGLEKWADTVAAVGPKLDETQLRPTGGGWQIGDLAVELGGYDALPYTRLIKQGNEWKIMRGPPNLATMYGLTPAQVKNLQELENKIKSDAVKAEALPALPPFNQSASTRPAATQNVAATRPTSSRTAAGQYAFLSPVLDGLVPALTPAQQGDREVMCRQAVDLAVKVGDPDRAMRLYNLLEPGDKRSRAGAVAVLFPGGAAGAAGQKLMRSDSTPSEFWPAAAGALARRGDSKGALAVANRLSGPDQGDALMRILSVSPTEAAATALAKQFRTDRLDYSARKFAQAYVVLDREADANRLLEQQIRLAKQQPARRGDTAPNQKLADSVALDIRSEMGIGWARSGKFERAEQLAQQIKADHVDAQLHERWDFAAEKIYQAIITELARRGDVAGIAAAAKKYKAYYKPSLNTYAYARAGDMAGTAKRLNAVRAGAKDLAAAYGMVIAARLAAGDDVTPPQILKQAMETLPDLASRTNMGSVWLPLLDAAINGPDAEEPY